MSAISEIVKYNNLSVAAGALHRDIVGPGKTALRRIWKALPPGAETVVQFLVVSDQEMTKAKIYHAATVRILNSQENKLTVSASIGVYAEGAYQTEKSLKKLQAPPSDLESSSTCTSLAIGNQLSNPSNDIVVYRHPLISGMNKKNLQSMNAEERCPNAFIIAEAINEIFQNGVPLPGDQRFHYCTFTTIVHIPVQGYQYLCLNGGIRGTNDSEKISSSWVSTSVQATKEDEAEGLDNKLATLRLEAEGNKPSGIPAGAQPVFRASTGAYTIKQTGNSHPSLTTNSGPRIEEI